MQLSLLGQKDLRASLTAERQQMLQLRQALPKHFMLGSVGPSPDLLREWTQHPLLQAYWWRGLDADNPIDRDAQHLSHELSSTHSVIVEVPQVFTTPRLADHRQNPAFLHAKDLVHAVVGPVRRVLGPRLFAVVLRFPRDLERYSLTPETFPARLAKFFAELHALEPSVSWAVELLPPAFVTLDYARVVAEHGIAPVVGELGHLSLLSHIPSAAKTLFFLTAGELLPAVAALRALPALPTVVCVQETGDGSGIMTLGELAKFLAL